MWLFPDVFLVSVMWVSKAEKSGSGGVTDPPSRLWADLLVLARTEDGSWQFCVDYRHFSTVTKVVSFTLPHIDDTVERDASSTWLSSVDLFREYYQVPLAPGGKERKVFTLQVQTPHHQTPPSQDNGVFFSIRFYGNVFNARGAAMVLEKVVATVRNSRQHYAASNSLKASSHQIHRSSKASSMYCTIACESSWPFHSNN